jgi:hypothetical protein
MGLHKACGAERRRHRLCWRELDSSDSWGLVYHRLHHPSDPTSCCTYPGLTTAGRNRSRCMRLRQRVVCSSPGVVYSWQGMGYLQ